VLCAEGSEAFESLPAPIRNLGPWTGGPPGEIDQLRLPYRVLLGADGFSVSIIVRPIAHDVGQTEVTPANLLA
jgi:hypothetical protein